MFIFPAGGSHGHNQVATLEIREERAGLTILFHLTEGVIDRDECSTGDALKLISTPPVNLYQHAKVSQVDHRFLLGESGRVRWGGPIASGCRGPFSHLKFVPRAKLDIANPRPRARGMDGPEPDSSSSEPATLKVEAADQVVWSAASGE